MHKPPLSKTKIDPRAYAISRGYKLIWFSVKTKTGWVEVDSKILGRLCNLKPQTARVRLHDFLKGRIDAEQMLARNTCEVRAEKKAAKPVHKLYTLGDKTYTTRDLQERLPGLSVCKAHAKLKEWVAGKMTEEELLTRDEGTERWDLLDCGPRRDVADIKVTPFERQMGEEIERLWTGKVNQEWL